MAQISESSVLIADIETKNIMISALPARFLNSFAAAERTS